MKSYRSRKVFNYSGRRLYQYNEDDIRKYYYMFIVSRLLQGEESTGRQSRPMPVYDVANTG